jgi:hypothetical protein
MLDASADCRMPDAVVVAVAVALGNAAAAHVGRRLFIWCLLPKFARRDCLLQFRTHPCPQQKAPAATTNLEPHVRRAKIENDNGNGNQSERHARTQCPVLQRLRQLYHRYTVVFALSRLAANPRSQWRRLPVSCRTQTLNHPHMYPVTKNRQPPCQYPTPAYHSHLYNLALAWPSSASASS